MSCKCIEYKKRSSERHMILTGILGTWNMQSLYTSYNPHDDESTGRFCVLDADFFCIGLPYTIPISYTVSENP